MSKTVLFQAIQLSKGSDSSNLNSSVKHKFTVLILKTVLFQAIQFSISTQFSSILPIDRTLSGATTLGQRGHGNNGNVVVLCISQSFCFTGSSPSESYPSAEVSSR